MTNWRQTAKPWGFNPLGTWTRRIGVFELVVEAVGRADAEGWINVWFGVSVAGKSFDLTGRWHRCRNSERSIAAAIVKAKAAVERDARKAGIAVPP